MDFLPNTLNHLYPITLTLPGPSAGVSGSLDSYCSLKPLCSGMGEVVPARTSPTLLPPSLALCCHYPVSKCCSASIVVTSTVRVKMIHWQPLAEQIKHHTECIQLLHISCSLNQTQSWTDKGLRLDLFELFAHHMLSGDDRSCK